MPQLKRLWFRCDKTAKWTRKERKVDSFCGKRYFETFWQHFVNLICSHGKWPSIGEKVACCRKTSLLSFFSHRTSLNFLFFFACYQLLQLRTYRVFLKHTRNLYNIHIHSIFYLPDQKFNNHTIWNKTFYRVSNNTYGKTSNLYSTAQSVQKFNFCSIDQRFNYHQIRNKRHFYKVAYNNFQCHRQHFCQEKHVL